MADCTPTQFVCRPRSIAAATLINLCLLLGTVGSQGLSREAIGTDPAEAEWEQWIDDLGAPRFSQREHATRQLLEGSLNALGPLEAAAARPDRETRVRSQQIIAQILCRERSQRIHRFVAGDATLDRYPLPGWQVLQAAAGDSPATRQFLADILVTEWDFLQVLENRDLTAPELQSYFLDGARVSPTNPVFVARCSAMLLAVLGRRTAMEPHSQALVRVYRLIATQSSRDDDASAMWQHGVFRRLAAEFFLATADGRFGIMALQIAARHQLPELPSIAACVLRTPSATAPVTQVTLLLLGQHGGVSQLPLVRSYLEDERLCQPARHDSGDFPGFEARVQDAALLAVWQLSGRDPGELGMPSLQPHPIYGFSPATVGFVSEDDRETARQRLRTLGD